jgi:hypothetical protein
MELPEKMKREVSEMINGCQSADLESNMRKIARVTRYLIKNGLEGPRVSLCVGSSDVRCNIATIQDDRHAIEFAEEMACNAKDINAHSLIFGQDFWLIPEESDDPRFPDLSVHPLCQKAVVLMGRRGRNVFLGTQAYRRRNGKHVFQSLRITELEFSWKGSYRPPWWGHDRDPNTL